MKINKLIILGSGPAGYTSAIYASRYNLNPTLITGLNEGGQLINTNNISNWPGEYNDITGINLMKKMKKQSIRFGTKIINDNIINVNFNHKNLILTSKKKTYITKTLIIATGSLPKKINLPNENKLYGRGISTCATCDGLLYKNKKVAVIGGGNNAIEEVLLLNEIAKKTYLIHRRENFKAENFLLKQVNKLIKKKKIKFFKKNIIKKIYKKNNYLHEIKIQSLKTKKHKNIKIDCLFLAIGQRPNTKIFQKKINLDKNGYIKINYNKKYKTMTNIKGIFAAGDVIDKIYKQAITASATGCMAAYDVKRYLSENN